MGCLARRAAADVERERIIDLFSWAEAAAAGPGMGGGRAERPRWTLVREVNLYLPVVEWSGVGFLVVPPSPSSTALAAGIFWPREVDLPDLLSNSWDSFSRINANWPSGLETLPECYKLFGYFCLFRACRRGPATEEASTALQSQKTVSAYFTSELILSFDFARRGCKCHPRSLPMPEIICWLNFVPTSMIVAQHLAGNPCQV